MGLHWDTGEEEKEEDGEGAGGAGEHLAEHLRIEREAGVRDEDKNLVGEGGRGWELQGDLNSRTMGRPLF